MKLFIKGRNITPQIDLVTSDADMMSWFDEVKDHSPIGDESQEHWEQRNDSLLAVLMLKLAKNKLREQDNNEALKMSLEFEIDQLEAKLLDRLRTDSLPSVFHY